MLALEVAILSEMGGRKANEDACGHWHSVDELCCVLADGAGGHGGGGVAARLVVARLLPGFAARPTPGAPPPPRPCAGGPPPSRPRAGTRARRGTGCGRLPPPGGRPALKNWSAPSTPAPS